MALKKQEMEMNRQSLLRIVQQGFVLIMEVLKGIFEGEKDEEDRDFRGY
jgi:hypothetical protein